MNKFKEAALSRKIGKAEIISLIIYIIGLIIIGIFHEVWFDEAQAWQIARCASIKEILFDIPHYEGHPPLWHLLLAVFAKNGAPVAFTLKAVNTVISASAIAFLLFKSPFPKIVRCGLPFTYFFFYQYGINSRPYCITMLAIFLAAFFYKDRNSQPWRYILALTLLCLSTAYGIILAGGLCLVWTFEIISEKLKNKDLKSAITDKRTHSLLFILISAILLISFIMPKDDTFYGNSIENKSLLDNLTSTYNLINFFCIPFDSWFGIGVDNIYSGLLVIKILYVICGITTWGLLLSFSAANKKLPTFFIPYIFTVSFMAFKYMSNYHIGISALFHIFIFWIIIDENGVPKSPAFITSIAGRINSSAMKKVIINLSILLTVSPVIYSITASYHDIMHNVGCAHFADFIKSNHLEDKKIMVRWKYIEDTEHSVFSNSFEKILADNEIPSKHNKITAHCTYLSGIGSVILPYFDRNILMNFNTDHPEDLYMHYKYKEDSKKFLKEWADKGLPDFILNYCPIDEIYDAKTLDSIKYLPVYKKENVTIFKLNVKEAEDMIYMREDLFDEYPQLHWIYDPKNAQYD